MSLLHTHPWEVQLLSAANEAFNSQRLKQYKAADNLLLEKAYYHCDLITKENSRTFYMASSLLPPDKRRAVRALYAFCRVTDDIVDNPDRPLEERDHELKVWRARVLAEIPPEHDLVCLAWSDTQVRFNIPRGYAEQLIDGCARDIDQARYETFADLAAYAYGVASTVGLMAMHIIGFESMDAVHYAVRLGVALQITNILRDVQEDYLNGRVYLPQDELLAFGIEDDMLAHGTVTDEWREFMRYQIERNRNLYIESLPGIALLNREGRFAIGAAAELYCAILDHIESKDYDVFSERAYISTWGKVRRLPMIWWRSQSIKL